MKIPYVKPSITEIETSFAHDAAVNGWGTKCYEYVERFEHDFGKIIGADYVIATSSCTGALTLGYSGLGLLPGDEVIVADANWIASIAPLLQAGVKVVPVDIDEETWCIDPDEVSQYLSSKTKAILATHLYGNMCDMDRLSKIAKNFNLKLIEDSAEALGSYFGMAHAGAIGDFGAFSFHGSKTITTGEGGAFVTNDKDLYEKVLTLSNHGRSKLEKKQFWPDYAGYKFKMSNIQAAIGCAQLERFDELVSRKKEILNSYRERLGKSPHITINSFQEKWVSGAWMPNIVFSDYFNFAEFEIVDHFKSFGIDARPFFWPLSSISFIPKIKDNPIARRVQRNSVNLPSYHDITDAELDYVCLTVESLIKRKTENM